MSMQFEALDLTFVRAARIAYIFHRNEPFLNAKEGFEYYMRVYYLARRFNYVSF